MLIAQLSDCHIMPPGQLAYGVFDTAACLRAALAALAALRPRPDLILLTGDVSEDGSAASYEQARAILGAAPAPVHVIPGNHDDREAMRRAFGADGYLPGQGPLHYVVDAGPVRIVALDTLVPGAPGGRLDADALAWLDQTLAAAPGRPTLVALHHPPFASGIAHMDAMALENPRALAQVLARHPQVERVVCGHLHRALMAGIGGRPAVACPSSCHQLSLDLAPGSRVSVSPDPSGYLLHLWREGEGLVTHVGVVPSPAS